MNMLNQNKPAAEADKPAFDPEATVLYTSSIPGYVLTAEYAFDKGLLRVPAAEAVKVDAILEATPRAPVQKVDRERAEALTRQALEQHGTKGIQVMDSSNIAGNRGTEIGTKDVSAESQENADGAAPNGDASANPAAAAKTGITLGASK